MHIAFTAFATALLACTAAFGDDSTSKALPGVTGDYRIAKPATQAEPDDALPANDDGSFKIGNTDVRIGGGITVDMRTGGTRIPNH